MAHDNVLCPACGKVMTLTSMIRGAGYVDSKEAFSNERILDVDDEVVCTWTCYCQGDNGDAINEHRTFPVGRPCCPA